MKTNAARLLDALGIAYELRDYDPGEEHLGAEEVARRIGLAPGQVFKTLVVRGAREDVLFAVLPLTGYVRGGVTALAAKKEYPTYVDETMRSFSLVSVSAGVRGTQIVLAPSDYLRATQASAGPISKPKARS